MSRCVLDAISLDGSLEVMGLGPEGVPVQTSVANFNSKTLCMYHNSALSPLDTLADRFFQKLTFGGETKSETVYGFNGHDLERWFLKCLLGFGGAGLARYKSIKFPKLNAPSWLLDILFGKGAFEDGLGLYISRRGELAEAGVSLIVRESSNPLYTVCGARVMLTGFQFVLTTSRPPSNPEPNALVGAVHRPSELVFWSRDGRFKTTLLLGWSPPWKGQTVTMKFSPECD
ncbi:hypothetical protein [Aeoliella sp.]|uniref:hypothetical protein n=1 Tax=Aeoliella sp. TaxID=2795800 RepID=UPI003CCC2471